MKKRFYPLLLLLSGCEGLGIAKKPCYQCATFNGTNTVTKEVCGDTELETYKKSLPSTWTVSCTKK